MTRHFYDAANSHNVPSEVYAAVPIDGQFAWSESEQKRMDKIIRYTVLGGAAAAHSARAIDIEVGDRANDPNFYMPFLIERNKHYGDATPYVNRSNLLVVSQHCHKAGILQDMRFWISTLDGTIMRGAWATQLQGGFHSPFDLSILQGVDDFVQP